MNYAAEHKDSKRERKMRSPASWDLHFHKRNAQQTGKQINKRAGSCYKYSEAHKERSGEGCWGEGREREAANLEREVGEAHPPHLPACLSRHFSAIGRAGIRQQTTVATALKKGWAEGG